MILPDPFPVFDSSQDDIQEITPERRPVKVQEPEKEKVQEPEKEKVQEPEKEKVMEPEKEKTPWTRAETLATERSMCPRSSTPAWPRKKVASKRHRVRTQDMIEEGLRFLDESELESIEDGCLLLGLTRDVIDLDESSVQINHLGFNLLEVRLPLYKLFRKLYSSGGIS